LTFQFHPTACLEHQPGRLPTDRADDRPRSGAVGTRGASQKRL